MTVRHLQRHVGIVPEGRVILDPIPAVGVCSQVQTVSAVCLPLLLFTVLALIELAIVGLHDTGQLVVSELL